MALNLNEEQAIAFASVAQQRQWLREGDLSPLELTHVYLDRIGRLDSRLGSYFSVMAEAAIADAQRKTEGLVQARHGGNLQAFPSLWGIPVAVKDLNAVAGAPQSYGVAALKARIAETDDALVSQLRQSGCILLGKTAIAQLASWPYSEPPGFLPCRNPWNLAHTAGGSSGGAAAAVAAGLCSLSQGSDGGGSLRTPAFCCGVVAIKPSRGRVAPNLLGDAMGGLAVNGPLGRSVADAATLLDALVGTQGGEGGSPNDLPAFGTAATAPMTPEAIALGPDWSPERRPLQVAYTQQIHPFEAVSAPCARAVRTVVSTLAAAGAEVQEIALSCEAWIEPFTVLWRAEVAAAGIPRSLLEPMNQWLLDQGDDAGTYVRSRLLLQTLGRSLLAQLAPFDVVVLPPCSQPAIPIQAWAALPPEAAMAQIIQWIAPSPLFNVTGQPVVSLPTGQTELGLPLGVQLVGRAADETNLIRLAAFLEQQLDLPPFTDIDRRWGDR